jgi:hypothetical protein
VPQEPPVQPIEYGHGKPSRRASRLAIASFVLVLPLYALVAANVVMWRSQPPPLSGFAGLGWFIGMASLFALLVIATLLVGPLSFALGVAGLWAVRSHPSSLSGRRLARLGVCLSLGACLLVGAAHYKVRHYIAGARQANGAAAPNLPPSQYPADGDKREVEQLVRYSQIYAERHDGKFPNDIESLHAIKELKDYSLWGYVAGFAYFGNGLTRDDFDATPQAENESVVLIVRRQPLPGTRWVVGLNGNGSRARAMVVADEDLSRLFDQSNRFRAKHGLPPIDFNGTLSRSEPTPATRPTVTTGTPQP